MTGSGVATRGLVVAKAPVPGRVKTRLGRTLGMEEAAVLASAALLDTLVAVTEAFGAAQCTWALDGDLEGSVGGASLAAAARGWSVVPQRGEGLGERLAAAHADVGDGPVVQVGMDTPQLSAPLLRDVAAGLEDADAVLGPATDGGWWVLALRDPAAAAGLAGVPMSTPQTGVATAAALRGSGLSVALAPVLGDVDTEDDAAELAAVAPGTAFAAAWARLEGSPR